MTTNWRNIPGWLSDEDAAEYGRLLDTVCPGEVVAEIGSLAGRSAVFAADRLRPKGGKLVCVDMWQYGELPGIETAVFLEAGFPDIWPTFAKNIEEYQDVITPVGRHSLDAAKLFRSLDAKFGLVYIDGAHDYESVKADIEAWTPLLRPGGIVCGHDYADPDVSRAVNEAFPSVKASGAIWSAVQPIKKGCCGQTQRMKRFLK